MRTNQELTRTIVKVLNVNLFCAILFSFVLASGPNELHAQRSMNIGSEQLFADTAGLVRTARLDDSHFLVFYKRGPTSSVTDLYARVGEVDSSTQTITWGPTKYLESGYTLRNAITTLNSNQVVIAYEWSDGEAEMGVARVLTVDVNQDTIGVGDTTIFHNAPIDPAFSHTPISMVRLTDERLAICFADDATDDGQVVIGDVSGSTISFGTAQEWNSGNVSNFWIDALSEDKIIISFEDDGSANDVGKALVGTVTGQNVSYGSTYDFYDAGASNSVAYTAVKSVDSNTAVIAYTRDPVNKGYAVVATITGTAISFGTHALLSSEVSSLGPKDITICNSYGPTSNDREVAVAFNTSAADTSFIANIQLNGTSLSINDQKFFGSEADDSWLININENILVLGFVDDDNADKGKAQVIKLSPSHQEILSSYSSNVSGSGTALDFDGVNDYVEIGNVAELTFDTAMTVEFWFNTDDDVGNYNTIVSKWYSGGDVNGGSYAFNYSNSAFVFSLQDTGNSAMYVNSANQFNDGRWHHVAGTWDGDSAKLYVDGLLIGVSGQSGFNMLDQDTRKTRIGTDDRYTAGTGDRHFNGKVDEVRFWRKPLDQATIRNWMCKKVTSAHADFAHLEGYYRFDQGSGTTLYDLQGNNNGTLINMDPATDWIGSNASIGDESKFTYGGSSLSDTLANGNIVTYQNLRGAANGIHLYRVNASPQGSGYPGAVGEVDSSEYFGAFLVGGKSYDVIIDYSSNSGINGTVNEALARGLKRAGNGDNTWEIASGPFQIDEVNNIIRIRYQTGTEFVTGFANAAYPNRSGSGYALDFDGSDDGIVSSNGGMSGMSTADSITLEAWFNTEDTTAFPFIYDSEDANSAAFRILFTSGQPRISIREALDSGGISIKTDSSFNDGQWHHVAFTYNGNLGPGGMNIYVDGVDVPTSWVANQSTSVANYSDSVYVGINRDMTWALDGKIDELRIWNSVLSQTTVRDWMTKKLTSSHVAINDLISYHRFDEGLSDTLYDLAGGATGILTNGPTWEGSGAALGDESFYTYGGISLSDTLSNGNIITLDDFSADGMQMYFVNDTATGSSFPSNFDDVDDHPYFGAFMIGGSNYDVTIDYSANNTINGQANESAVRALKRSGGDDADWEVATGYFGTDAGANTILIAGQTGTEYVTGFSNSAYPERSGSGYALELDGVNDYVSIGNVSDLSFERTDPFTIESWIKISSSVTSGDFNLIVSKIVNGGAYEGYEFGVWPDGPLYIQLVSNVSTNNIIRITTDGTVDDDKWHHVAVSYDGSSNANGVRFYIDGILQTNSVLINGLTTSMLNTQPAVIGSRNASTLTFEGELDEVRAWSSVLDSGLIREWMTKKITNAHDSIDKLLAYYRFDDATGTTLADLAGGNDGTLTNMDSTTAWVYSGAALGDESFHTYGGNSISDTLSNSNVITLDGFGDADGMHLYFVNAPTEGSSFPGTIVNQDSTQYFGAFMVGGSSYNVTIDYSANNTINGQANEAFARALKRSGGDDADWELATGYFGTNATANTISIPNQTGTEYVTGFSNSAYPERPGAGYTLDFDGVDDQIDLGVVSNMDFTSGAVECWINPSYTISTTTIMAVRSTAALTRWSLHINEITDELLLWNGTSLAGVSYPFDTNQWYHIAVNLSSDSSAAFINGQFAGNLPGIDTADVGLPFIIGSPNVGLATEWFKGNIDEVRVWSDSLNLSMIREWMTKKVNASHDSISNLVAYYRFDDAQDTTLFDLVGGNNGTLTNMDTTTDWVYSGAALGDESFYTYGGNALSDTLSNGNVITLDDFGGADGMHLYFVNEGADGSSYPGTVNDPDTNAYFGAFMVGGSSYDVTIDYSNNTSINGVANEGAVRGVKRSGGDDATWELTTGFLQTNVDSNTIRIPNQTGTEYVTGFANSVYPVRPGSGFALDFDGANDYVTMGDVSAVEGQSQLTIEAWIKPESFSNFRGIVSKFGGSASVALDLTAGGSTVGTSQDIFFRVANGANSYGHTTNEPMQANEWLHVAAVFDGTQATNNDRITLYVNGISQSLTYSGTFPTTTSSNTADLEIGRYQSLYEFDGSIDEVRIWQSALTQDLVREWMTKKLTNAHDSISELVGYYRFDESEGSNLFDLAGGNHGVLTNMDTTTDWVYSGAALGDANKFTYSATQVVDTMANGNEITLDDFAGADAIHLYQVNDTIEGSSYPSSIPDRDSTAYFGVFMVGGETYDVTIDYTNNTGISAAANEDFVRAMRRSGGDDATWEKATGAFRTDATLNTISILNQTGTEYVTGFTDTIYPARTGAGYALDFDGVDDRITIPYDATLDFDSNDFSVAAWVNLVESPADLYPMILGWRTSATNGFLLYAQTGSRYLTAQISGVNYTSTTAINDSKWHHVAFTRTSGNCTLYVDGVSVHTFSAPASVNATNVRYIGNEPHNSSQSYFEGRIDEVSIWSTGLDSADVRDWMCKKLNGSNSNLSQLVAYYRFDEGSGTTLEDLEGGNDGTLTNMDPTSDWVYSGAALGDSSTNTYSASTLASTLSIGADVILSDFANSDGIHLYKVNGTSEGSAYPASISAIDSTQYFGVFRVGGTSYDIEIDYSGAASLTGLSNEINLRTLKRDAGDDPDWEIGHGQIFVDTTGNNISLFNQVGTEYVLGINNTSYPNRAGSGNALSFDGTNDYISIDTVSNAPAGANKRTYEVWYKTVQSTGNVALLNFGDGGTNGQRFSVRVKDSNTVGVGLSGSNRFYTANNAADGEWHHLAVSMDSGAQLSQIAVYHDGILMTNLGFSSGTQALVPNTENREIFIGSNENQGTLADAEIDEVRIWNDALDSNTIRKWMCRKVDASHEAIEDLVAYYRFDESSGTELEDLAGANTGTLINGPTWQYSGAALGDDSKFTYDASSLVDTLANSNIVTLDDFTGADGIHLYHVTESPIGSSYPNGIDISTVDSTEYFGVFKVGGTSYDVTIDYSNNTSINGSANEKRVRGIKRSGGDDASWSVTTGELRTNTTANTISIFNQTGTEYVTGFATLDYPSRPGSGYALDFDGIDDQIYIGDVVGDQGDFTFSTWFNSRAIPSGSAQEGLFVRGNDGSGAGWSIATFLQADSTLRGAIVHSGGAQVNADGTTKIIPGDWHHVALTFDSASGDLRLFLDGLEEATANSGNSTLRSSTLGNFIGRGNLAAEAFDGALDEFAVWNVALDTIAIRDWMCRKVDSNHQNFSNMVAYYRFDESVNDTLIDLVGGFDGPLANMAANDWIFSGASIGDTSAYDYTAAAVSMSYADGDVLHVLPFSGAPEAIHVYRVDEAPNDPTIPIGVNSIDTTHYYGFFMAGGTNPRGYVYLDYANNANYTSVDNGDQLLFGGRDGNDDDGFNTKASAIFTNLTDADSLVLFSQSSGTEVLAAQSSYLTPPGSGYALDFDGTDDYVTIPHANAFNMNAVTIETWVYWDGGGSAVEFICGKANEQLELHINEAGVGVDSALRFIPTTGVYLDLAVGSFTPNKWHHIAAVYDPSQSLGQVFLNGVLMPTNVSGSLSTAITTSASDVLLGLRGNGTFPLDGQLDEFRIWNAALDSNVIRKWMSRKMDFTHDSISHLVSYYRFDQLGDTNLIDLIGGNHGALTNMDETTDWVTSGAAIGDMSVYTYGGNSLSIQEPSGDSIILNGFSTGVEGAQLYYVAERSNSSNFYGAQSTDTSYYFGVHKVGDDTATYNVTYYYGNSAQLTGSSNEYRVALAKRNNNADASWEADWFYGSTNVDSNTVFLPNQTGTEYAGIVSANNALHFDGTNDVARISDQSDLRLSNGAFSVEFWAQATTAGRWVVSKDYGNGDLDYLIGQWSNSWRFTARNLSIDISSSTINLNQWYHVACVFDGTEARLYVDGVLENTDVTVGSAVTNTADVLIGARTSNSVQQFYGGDVDELRIWRRALCEDEIQSRISCQLDTNNQDSLVAYYSFNQGVADSTNTGLDSLIDLSGNGYHGTLNNMALSGSTSNWTSGSTGISGSCSPYISPIALVVSEGDTIYSGDTLVTTADSTDFGNVILNQTHVVQYSILNDGGETLDIDSVFFTGQDSAFFFALHSDSVAPGDTGFINVLVTPTTPDSIWATLNIATNECTNSPYSYRMQGNVLGYAGAMNFDGVNDYVLIPDTLGYLGMDEMTVEAWIRVESSTGTLQAIFSSPNAEMFHFQVSNLGTDNNVYYTESGVVGLPIIPETPYNVWKHVAMVVKSGESRVFVNGTQLGATSTATYDSILVSDSLRIGSGFGSSRFFNGDIDEVRLWNRALDSTEIQANMSCELEGTECGLIAYYNFNSDSAIIQGTNTTFTVIGDSSGNGKDGSLVNMTLNTDSSNWVAQSDSILNNCIDNGDLVGPIVIPVDTLEVWIDSTGFATIDSAQADSATCDYYSGVQSFAVSLSSVSCANDGDTLTLYATDSAGLSDSATFIVRVRDSIPPIAIARTQILYLNDSGLAITSADTTNNGSFDQCLGIDSISISQDTFVCADLTIVDPPAIDAFSASILLYGSGPAGQTFIPTTSGFLTTVTVYLRKTSIGSATRTLQIIDGDPNQPSSEASQTFTLAQNVLGGQQNVTFTNPPYVIAGNTYSIKLPDLANTTEGAGYAVATAYTNGTRWTGAGTMTENTGSDHYFVTYVSSATNVQTTVLTVTDSSGNIGIDTSYIAVLDTIRPQVFGQNVTIALDSSGSAVLTAAMFDSASADNCSIDSLFIDADTVSCASLGSFNVELKVFDPSGNVDSVTLLATVIDTIAPTAIGQSVTVALDSSGNAIVSADSANNASTDNCAIDSIWLSDSTVTCADTGGYSIFLVVQDASGNIDSTSVTVNVIDANGPNVLTQDITVYLGSGGFVTIDTSDVLLGANDNCGIDSMYLSVDSFFCSSVDTGGGGYSNTGIYWSNYGTGQVRSANNDGTGSTNMVSSQTTPSAAAYDIEDDKIYWLNNSGGNVMKANGDGSGITTLVTGGTSPRDIVVDPDNDKIYWSDFNGGTIRSANTDGTSVTTLASSIGPLGIWLDRDNQQIYWADLTGSAVRKMNVDGSGITTVASSQSDVRDVAYDASADAVYWTQGSAGTIRRRVGAGAITTFKSGLTQPYGIFLDEGLDRVIWSQTGTSNRIQGCDLDGSNQSTLITGLSNPVYLSFGQGATSSGPSTMLTVVDQSGNSTVSTANITVLDTLPPTVVATGITVYLDSSGIATIDTASILTSATDNCQIDSMWLSQDTFSCADTNGTIDTLFVRDVSGNIGWDTATMQIIDSVAPELVTQTVTLYIQANGESDTLQASDLVAAANDNCAVADTTLTGSLSYTCADISTPDTGTALTYNGSTSYASVPHDNALNPTTAITVEAWINTNSTANQKIVGKCRNGGATNGFSLGISSGNVNAEFYTTSGNQVVNASGLSTNTWTHIAMTRTTGGFNRAFINGVLIDSNAASSFDLGTDTNELHIGIAPYNFTQYFMDGEIDEVRIWNIERSEADILADMNACLTGNETGLIAYYKFDEGSGSTFTDYTSNGNNGVLNNIDATTGWVPGTPDVICSQPHVVNVEVTDVSGNSTSQNVSVILLDTIRPTVVTQTVTVELDSLGSASITANDVNNGSSDNCGIDSIWLSLDSFSCSNLTITNMVALFARDSSGNVNSDSAQIIVLDTTKPTLFAQNVVLYLDTSGTAFLAADSVDSASFDACGIDSIWVSDTLFGCSDTLAPDTVYFYAMDASGNYDSVTFTVTTFDTVSPVVLPQSVTVYLDDSGTVVVPAINLIGTSSDNCAIDSVWLSDSTFTCADSNINGVTLFVKDVSGNVSSDTTSITVLDTIAPIVITQPRTVYLTDSGTVSIAADTLNNGSSDNCAVDTIWLSASSFSCADTTDTLLTLFVRDVSGNISSDTATLTILDTTSPIVITKDITIYLDGSGQASILPDTLDSASTDNCTIAQLWLSDSTFTCGDTASVNTITLFAIDVSGNTSSATAIVTVLDTTPPVLVTNNLSIALDSMGTVTIANDSADAGTNDNCALDSVWLSQTTYGCADVGSNSITFFAVDSAGNVDSTTITVTVTDPIAPVAIAGNYTLPLDSFGQLLVTAMDIDSGSWDSCGIATYVIDDSTFNCADVGTTSQIVLTVTDVNGNVSIDTGSVTIEDDIAPEVITRNITVYLDTGGNVTITASQVDSATWDSCGVATLVLDVTSFDCGDVGNNTVTLTATDVNGNVNSGNATVTVLDTVHPTALAVSDTIFLDIFGFGIITPDSINNGSFDNCSGITMDLSVDTVFCTDVGTFVPVDLYVTDASGNIDTATVSVYVDDTIPPVPVSQNINVLLDSNGFAVITKEQVILSISDSCALDSIYINVDTVTCSEAGDTLTIISTAVDTVGNTGYDTTLAFIFDSIAPALFLNDTILYLSSDTATSGEVVIDSASLDSATFDACGLASVVHQTSFTCSDLGVNTVTVTVTDIHGNVSIGTVSVTVLDTVRPVAIANDTFRILNNAGSTGVPIVAIDGGSYDNCAVTFRSRAPHVVDCDDVGFINVVLNVFDTTGNVDSVNVVVEVIDQTFPSIFTQNITVSLDSTGNTSITAAMLDSATTDACGLDSIWIDSMNFNCSEVGNNTVEFFAEDVNGNLDSTDVIVTVVDDIAPVVVVQNDTIALDANGDASTSVAATLVSATDACGVDSTYLSDSTFTCGDVGSNAVTMTVVDVNGNTTVTNLNILVIDSIPPTIQAVDTTIYLSSAGTAVLDTSYVNNGTFDNCGIATFTLDSTNFDCSYHGQTVTVTLTVTDVNGNVSTETVEVDVLDTVRPFGITQNITVQLDANGNDTIDWSLINNGSTDACGITQYMLSDSIFNCADTGDNVIHLYVTDVNGNTDTVAATVTVEDNVGPLAFSYDSLDVFLDVTGNISITVDDIDSASSDSCGIDTMIISQYDYDCSDIGAPIIVTLTVTDVNGNVASAQTAVSVYDTIAPTVIAQNDTVYLDTNGQFTILPTNVDSGSWDSCGIASWSIDTSAFDCANTGQPVTVTLTVTDIHGNSASDSSLVYVVDTLLPTVVCRNDTTIFNDSGQCGAVFVFDTANAFDNCAIDTIIQTDGSGLVSGDEFPVGVTTIEYTAIDVNGNQDSCSFTITVLDTQAPIIICQADTTICDSVITYDLPTVLENCAVDSLVLVSGIESGGTFPVGQTTNTFAVTDEAGNSDTCSYIITRLPYPSQANAGSDTSICESFTFNLDATPPAIGVGSWTSVGGPVAADTADPKSGVLFLNYGQNLFIWTVRNGVCVPNSDSVYVEVSKTPAGGSLPANISLCQEDSVVIEPEPVEAGSPIWTIDGDGIISDSLSDTISITNLQLGRHTIYRAIQSGACVALRDSMMVYNNEAPTIEVGDDVTRFAGKDVDLDPIVTGVASAAWEPSGLFSDASAVKTTVSADETTLLSVIVTSDSGCVASDSLYYIVNGLDSIPTGITPNGDGINDVWNIPGLSTYPGAEVFVFDQAGREIFHSTGYDTPWDGTFNGNVLPRASYYWIIDLKDGVNDPLKGIISIIR